MNVELLKKVATKLKRMRHKKHFDMRDWAKKTDCGTAACIAGHVLLGEGYKLKFEPHPYSPKFISPKGHLVDPEIAARRILKLSEGQAERLFKAMQWPGKFGGGWARYNDRNPKFNNPKVAAARIEHFIATKGKE